MSIAHISFSSLNSSIFIDAQFEIQTYEPFDEDKTLPYTQKPS